MVYVCADTLSMKDKGETTQPKLRAINISEEGTKGRMLTKLLQYVCPLKTAHVRVSQSSQEKTQHVISEEFKTPS